MSEVRTVSQIMCEPNGGHVFAGIVRENPERAEWLIGPVGIHRDSNSIAESNWRVTLARFEALDPAGDDYAVYHFGHWAVGWVEEIAYRAGSPIAAAADEIRESLAIYAILDEHDHSTLESEQVEESWRLWQDREVRRDLLAEFISRIAGPDDMSADELEEWIDGLPDSVILDALGSDLEIEDGCYRIRARDIERAADALLAIDDVEATTDELCEDGSDVEAVAE